MTDTGHTCPEQGSGPALSDPNRLGDLLNATDSHTETPSNKHLRTIIIICVQRTDHGQNRSGQRTCSVPIFNIRSICARISPCPDNDIAPQLCNWRENISTINQPKGSDIGVESKPGKDLLRRHQNPRWIVIALSTHYEQDSWCNISLSEHWSTWSWLVWPEKWKHWSETNSHPVRRHISARLSFSSIELSSMG